MVRTALIVGSLGIFLAATSPRIAVAHVVAPSTWATSIVIDVQPRDENGVPVGSPIDAAFDDWDDIPLALSDPADNPSPLNLIDIKDVKIANDHNFIYIYASGHRQRTNGMYIAFDTDQNPNSGFDIFGLGLVGSELGYVSDFPFDQRTPGVFNNNIPPSNAAALLYPGWDVEFGQRELAVPLNSLWSASAPLGPIFPTSTFNFILWTNQGLSDVTDVIVYTLAVPEPSSACLLIAAAVGLTFSIRRR